MKIVRYKNPQGEEDRFGILDGDNVYKIEGDIFGDYKVGVIEDKLANLVLLSPTAPSKVVCIGLNYTDHIKEMNFETPEEPTIFIKPSTTVIGSTNSIIYPESTNKVDYEGELAIVIKKTTKDVEPEVTKKYILGYTCANDVTARDLQIKDGQWTRGKSFDTFCPIGPWIETDVDPGNLKIETFLNGVCKQRSNTSNLLFPVDVIVSFISKVMTLNPGDVIITGTPSGVGPMVPGDTVEVKIEGIGTLENSIIRKTAD